MNFNNKLFEIIQTLSISEKRLLKRYMKLYRDKNNNKYMVLFDVYNALESYDKEIVAAKLKREGLYKYRNQLNAYLYKIILDFLVMQSKKSKVLLLNQVKQIEVLFERGLYRQVKTIVKQAKKKAYQKEAWSILEMLIRLELKAEQRLLSANTHFNTAFDALYKERKLIQQKIQQILDFEHLQWDVNHKLGVYNFKTDTEAKTYLHNILSKDIFQMAASEQESLPLRIRANYYRLLGLLLQTTGKAAAAYDIAQKYEAVIETNFLFFTKNLLSNHYGECMYLYVLLGKKENAWQIYQKLDILFFEDEISQARLLEKKYRRLFNYYRSLALEEATLDVIAAFEKDEVLIKKHIDHVSICYLYYALITFCMYKKWYEVADIYIRKTLELPQMNGLTVVYRILNFYRVIISVEKGNQSLATSYLRAMYHNKQRLKRNVTIENILLKKLTKINNLSKDISTHKYWQELKDEVLALPKEKIFWAGFDRPYLLKWIESQIQNLKIKKEK